MNMGTRAPDPLDVACPSCEVEADEFCVHLRGSTIGQSYGRSYYHTDRRIAAVSFSNGQSSNSAVIADMFRAVGEKMAELEGERDKYKDRLDRIAAIILED